MKKRILGASLVCLLVGFYCGNNIRQVRGVDDLVKELKVLFEPEQKSICEDCVDGFGETTLNLNEDATGEGTTILELDAGSLDGGANE